MSSHPLERRYIGPVARPLAEVDHSPVIHNAQSITSLLESQGVQGVQLNEMLQGGYMSQVHAGTFEGVPIVVKHTEDIYPSDPTTFFISRETINTDAEVLKRLQGSPQVRVPALLGHWPQIATTMMGDVRGEGFELMVKQIGENRFPLNSAQSVGRTLALLSHETQGWEPFPTTCSAGENIYDRGLELRMFYPNTQKQYLKVEERFLTQNQTWVWVDGTPKNIMINPRGDVMFIDFGLSCFGDQQHTLPNFLSHIGVYAAAGKLRKQDVAQYIQECTAVYKEIMPLDEQAFCEYFGMEVLHRAMGKRIPQVDQRNQKVDLVNLGLSIFDEGIQTIESLVQLFS